MLRYLIIGCDHAVYFSVADAGCGLYIGFYMIQLFDGCNCLIDCLRDFLDTHTDQVAADNVFGKSFP